MDQPAGKAMASAMFDAIGSEMFNFMGGDDGPFAPSSAAAVAAAGAAAGAAAAAGRGPPPFSFGSGGCGGPMFSFGMSDIFGNATGSE